MSSFSDRIREWWIPTNSQKLIDAERAVLKQIRTPFIQTKVPVGGSHAKEYINTITFRPDSTSTSTSSSSSSTSSSADSASHLVLIHGYGAGVGMWTLNADDIASNFNGPTHLIDLLGHGTSSRPDFNASDTHTAESFFVDSIEEWRNALGIHKLTLCGHSFGGYMSAVYALKYPHRVERLILASPVGVPPTPDQDTRFANAPFPQRAMISTFRFLWSAGATPQSIVRFMGPWGRKYVDGYVQNRFVSDKHMNHNTNTTDNNNSTSTTRRFLNKELTSDYLYHCTAAKGSGEFALSKILKPGAWAYAPLHDRLTGISKSIPVHFLYGSHDWMDPEAGQRALENMRKHGHHNNEIRIIDGAGHQLTIDQPTVFAQELIDAFKKWKD